METIKISKNQEVALQLSAKTTSHLRTQSMVIASRLLLLIVKFKDISSTTMLTLLTKRMQLNNYKINSNYKWLIRIINHSIMQELEVQFKIIIRQTRTTRLVLHRCRLEIYRRIWQK
jgi:hypothetical protein